MQVIARAGKRSLSGVVDTVMTRTDTPKRGDVVAIDSSPFDAMGICLGREAVFLHYDTYRIISLRKIAHAWRV